MMNEILNRAWSSVFVYVPEIIDILKATIFLNTDSIPLLAE